MFLAGSAAPDLFAPSTYFLLSAGNSRLSTPQINVVCFLSLTGDFFGSFGSYMTDLGLERGADIGYVFPTPPPRVSLGVHKLKSAQWHSL